MRSTQGDAVRDDVADVASGASVNAIAGAINGGLGFLFTLLVARELGTQGAGALFEAIAVFSVIAIASELGAASAIVRSVARCRALFCPRSFRLTVIVGTLPSIIIGLGAGVALLGFASDLAPLLVHRGDRAAVSTYLRVLGPFLPFVVSADILLGATRGFGTMIPSAATELIVMPAARIALFLLVVKMTYSPTFLGLAWGAPAAAAAVLAFIALRSLGGRLGSSATSEIQAPDTRRLALDFWRFALPQSLSSILQVSVLWIDVVLLGALKSTDDAGTYATLSRYLMVGTLALSAISLAIAPRISNLLAEGAVERAERLYRAATGWIVAIAFPIYVVMAIFAATLMRLFGRNFTDGAVPLAVLAIAMLANVATGPVVTILLMGGRSGLVLFNSSIAFGCNLALNITLIPRYGMLGAAVAWSVGIVAMNGLGVLQVQRIWKMNPFGADVCLTGACAILAYGGVGLMARQVVGVNTLALVATGLVATLIHGTVLWRIRDKLMVSAFREMVTGRRTVLRSA